MSNETAYRQRDVVDTYVADEALQPPERVMLELLRDRLSGMSMLDVGVGGGRTTTHLAGLVREYVGIDYSSEMIDACRSRFAHLPDHVTFETCDARSLDVFEDDRFDLILFSFNGIDYVTHEERLRVLREIRRVGKAGGYFCFSSHNLQRAPHLFELRRQLCWHPETLARRLVRWFLLRFVHNERRTIEGLGSAPHAVFNDGALRYRLRTYYVTPREQLRQLAEGFDAVRVFTLDGAEIGEDGDLERLDDAWIYYLCVIRPAVRAPASDGADAGAVADATH